MLATQGSKGDNPVTWTRETRNVDGNVDGGDRGAGDGEGDDAVADADGEDREGEEKDGATAAGTGGEGGGEGNEEAQEKADDPSPEARRRSGRTIRAPKRQLETIAPVQNQRRTRQKIANSGVPVIKQDAAVGDGTVERTEAVPVPSTSGQDLSDLAEQAALQAQEQQGDGVAAAVPPKKKKQAMRNSGRVDRRTGAYVQYPNPKAIKGQPMDQVQPMSRSLPQSISVSQGEGGSSSANQSAAGMVSFQASPYGEGVLPTLDNTSQSHPASASQPYFPHPGSQQGPDPHLYPHLAASSSSTVPHPHSPTSTIPHPHAASSIPTHASNIRRPPTPPSPSRITPIDPSIPDPPYELIPYESCVTLRKWGINPRDLMIPERGRGCPFSGMGVVGGGGSGGGGIGNADEEEDDEKGKGKSSKKGTKGGKFSPSTSLTSAAPATASASASAPLPGHSANPPSGPPPPSLIPIQLCKNRIDWNRSSWERHVFSHLPEKLKPYWQCPVCMRTFARKDSFKRHFGPGAIGGGGGGEGDPNPSNAGVSSVGGGGAGAGGGRAKGKGKGKKGAKGKGAAAAASAGQGEEGPGGPEVKCWEEGNLGSIPENEWARRWLVEPVVVR
jgi:hypothetical protein